MRLTRLVGILNLTPDSFSDGGKYDAPAAAYDHAQTLIAQGADVLDIGAESTRPRAVPIAPEEEWSRLSPVLADIVTLARQHKILVSLDTRHAQTVEKALHAGVDWINDVSGGASPALLKAVAQADAGYVATHSLGVPADPSVILSQDRPAIAQVMEDLTLLLEKMEKAGIGRNRVILDAGLGFGKDARQSLSLLWDMPKLAALGCPVLVGHSRKSFLSLISAETHDRDILTLLASSYLMQCGMDYLRVHDVRSHVTLRTGLSAQSPVFRLFS